MSINSRKHRQSKRKRELRTRLRKKLGDLCYYCKQPMIFEENPFFYSIPNPPNQATIEHLMTRLDGRTQFAQGERVLACRQCNNNRG